MLRIVTWNIQWGLGIDETQNLKRLIGDARAIADFDVLCLQEVSDNFANLKGNDGSNQFAELGHLLPGYTAIEGVGLDIPDGEGGRRRFGNMILSRLPVKQVYRHLLPYPCEPGVAGMPRIAVEAVVAAPFGDVRVITTHLEYYSPRQRMAQVDGLRTVYADGHAHARDATITKDDGTPFQTFLRPKATIVTGDFNFEPDWPEHPRMLQPFADATPPLHDAWQLVNPGAPHPSTFCIYQKTDPSGAELHCDFIFVNSDLAPHVRGIAVDQQTQASDHQPVIVTLA